MIPRPHLHVLDQGDSGGGKSSFAATFPKPMLVLFFDPRGKDQPYLKHHAQRTPPRTGKDERGTPFTEVTNRHGKIIRVEYYHDADIHNPDAYRRMENRMATFEDELPKAFSGSGEPGWKTLVIDSATFLDLAARKWAQYSEEGGMTDARDPRKWYGASKEKLEEFLLLSVGGLQCNVVTLCHIDESKDEVNDEFVRNPALPGKLSKRAPAAYGEMYRSYSVFDEDGQRQYVVQTRARNGYNASTQIDAPDPSYARYSQLWVEYDRQREAILAQQEEEEQAAEPVEETVS